MKINVHYVYPPIPIRNYDYQATPVNSDGEGPTGCGSTREEAIADLADRVNLPVDGLEVVGEEMPEEMPKAKQVELPPTNKRPRMYAVIGQMHVPGQGWVWCMSYPREKLEEVKMYDFGPGVMGRINQSIMELPGE